MFNLIVGINILQRARASLVEENMAAHYYNTEHVHPYSWDQVCLTIVHCLLLKHGLQLPIQIQLQRRMEVYKLRKMIQCAQVARP